MSIPEKFLKEFELLLEQSPKEVIDFAEYLKIKEGKEVDKVIDKIIIKNAEAFKELAK